MAILTDMRWIVGVGVAAGALDTGEVGVFGKLVDEGPGVGVEGISASFDGVLDSGLLLKLFANRLSYSALDLNTFVEP